MNGARSPERRMSGRRSVWVVGGTGYSGLEAVRLLRSHPFFGLARVFASAGSPGRDLASLDPSLPQDLPRAEPFTTTALEDPPAAALLALPDEAAAALAPRLLEGGIRVVDLSGAFRIGDAAHYPAWCGFGHPRPDLLREAVYGLTEHARGRLPGASLVANPGCYPTATLLALLPIERAGLVEPAAPIVVDAKSGVTGAGRKIEAAYLFAEIEGNLRPYKALHHRHVPEIRQELGLADERDLLFAPHLLPVARGLLVTAYLKLRPGVTAGDLAGAYAVAYAGEGQASPFVRPLGEGRWPEIRGVVRSNRCDIGWVVDAERRTAVVVSAIDNLLKGAAGQAVQNLNLMFGRPEEEGLPA